PLEKPFPEEEPAGPGSSSGNEPGRSSSSSAPAPRRPHVTFGDDVDDLVESLGLGSGADGAGNAQRAPGGQGLRKGRAGIRELLGGGSAGKILEQPGRAEFQADPKDREQPGEHG
ncbi:FBF1 factor, partial [Aphelocoma coerulescens]|nr:FBF1 factor [Aphelocoma coerulescens]